MSDTVDNDCCEVAEHPNVEFFDHGEVLEEMYRHSYDETRDAGKLDETMCLVDFLKRPVQLQTITWSNSLGITVFEPYVEMFRNESIRIKLSNYHLFRSDMKIRIVVNGSPFNYGRLMVVYVPFRYRNPCIANVTALSTATPYLLTAYCSSLPHVWVNPSSNNTVELDIPFIYPQNWMALGLNGNSLIGAEGATQIGSVYVIPSNALRQANGGSTPLISVTMYGMFTNPEVAGPINQFYTANMLDLEDFVFEMDNGTKPETPKGKNKVRGKRTTKGASEDIQASENGGKFSSTTLSVSNWLGHLTDVPLIGPYAKASSIALSGIGNLAKLFGFARPYDLSPERTMLKRHIPDQATTTGAFPGYKLAVDPNNAVTVDPRVGGFTVEDEMTVASLASKEFFLKTWELNDSLDEGDAIGTVLLNDCQTCAEMYNSLDSQIIIPSPIRFVTANFRYWKGTLRYRFQLVASQYHRARVLIWYNPNSEQVIYTGPASIPTTTSIVKIMDLHELDGFTIDFPWSNAQTMCQTGAENESAITPFQVGQTVDIGYEHNNGSWQMIVVNKLQSATEVPTPIEINVWVSCPDLQVARPKYRTVFNINPIAPANLFEVDDFTFEADDSNFEAFDALGGYESYAVKPFDTGRLMGVIIGEEFRSFRLLLKRFMADSILYQEGTRPATRYVGTFYPQYPRTDRFSTTYSTGGSATNTYAVVKAGQFHLFELMRFAYLACRGGSRHCFVSGANNLANMTHRFGRQGAITFASSNSLGTGDLFNAAIINGSGFSRLSENSTLPCEIPYYERDRFKICMNPDFSTGITDGSIENGIGGMVLMNSVNADGTTATRELHSTSWAAADDFSFHYYVCAPPIYEDLS